MDLKTINLLNFCRRALDVLDNQSEIQQGSFLHEELQYVVKTFDPPKWATVDSGLLGIKGGMNAILISDKTGRLAPQMHEFRRRCALLADEMFPL